MFSPPDARTLLLIAPLILLSLTVHEYAHARMAEARGDPTARLAGRVTLNPLAHLDPIGTLMLLFGPLGWARPVPYDPHYFRNPRQDVFLVAAAGPASNLALGFLLAQVLRWTPLAGVSPELGELLWRGILINLSLAFFNLIPIPPLDGSRIAAALFPPGLADTYARLEPWAPLLLMLLILPGMFTGWSPIWAMIEPLVRVTMLLFVGRA